jgi:hypothetical protein
VSPPAVSPSPRASSSSNNQTKSPGGSQ